MWLPASMPVGITTLVGLMAALVSPAAADGRMLKSSSLNTCPGYEESSFRASLFNVVFTPGNGSIEINIVASSTIQGKVTFDATVTAYGYEILRKPIDPCTMANTNLCPMVPGKFNYPFNIPLGGDTASRLPAVAYGIPDLDAKVKVFVNLTSTGETVACLEANISNGKTVDMNGVKWATAILAALALMSSAVFNALGHPNTASHLAANSLSLFGYFQSQAIVGLTSVHLPPVIQSWTQNFQWSMGIIRVAFMQDILTWYLRATGGEPASLLNSLTTVSVQVQKRSEILSRSLSPLFKRANMKTGSGSYVVMGIQRVAFRARIETTNLFMTSLMFFVIFSLLVIIAVAGFKAACELAAKKNLLKNDRFLAFRGDWSIILKGILYRVCLIGFPLVSIMCLWEFTQKDSPAEVVLAVFFLLGVTLSLAIGAVKIIRVARRSKKMHGSPAYILYSNPRLLNHLGFLYIQFRASAHYFIAPLLAYTLVKAMFVALSQHNGVVQAVGFIILDAAALIAASVLRPWMDKTTNTFNISICAVSFLNSIFLLVFCNVIGAPGLVIGVISIVFFILNAVFSLILLLIIIIVTVITVFRKNPDARYPYMADDRMSFIKSQAHMSTCTELDALAATARGDKGFSAP
ncbi:calcium- spray protein [Drechmeria coniospora]|uniref:Calcium-spray protein n=1 Tax=Drechmeria coniospora TaxID=98403 RepID=A0A151GVH2_DRECN|nr:calcium- spray protein [Drechmeria coniospora]KYK61104.1 calcium- spray protein [Drechmeria coniospora]